jgi:nitrile hydratase
LNSVHDIGGMDGFGPIEHETNEPVFHEPWERRVFAMRLINPGLPPTPVDALRHRGERLDPVTYLSSSYYERWLAGMERELLETGTLNREEIEARMAQFAADPDLPMPRREDPATAEHIVGVFRAGRPAVRKIRQKPRFAIGDKIVTRNLNPHGHTRLPRYARSRHGVIVAHHGAHVFPDTNAHGFGENPQHLYTVRIAMRELWGADAEANETVLIDLWESYLEKEKVKSVVGKSAPGGKNSAKTGLAAAAGSARASKRARGMRLPTVTPAAPGRLKTGKRRAKLTRAKASSGVSRSTRPAPPKPLRRGQ